MANLQIPVVDMKEFGGAKEDVSEDVINDLASQLHQAFSTIGFIYLKNHGISQTLVR